MIKIQSKNKKYLNALEQRKLRLKKAAHMNLIKGEFTLADLAEWLEVENATAGQFVKQFSFLLNTHGAKKNRTYSWNTTFEDIKTNAGKYAVQSFGDDCKSLQPDPKDDKDRIIEKQSDRLEKLQDKLIERDLRIKNLESELEEYKQFFSKFKELSMK